MTAASGLPERRRAFTGASEPRPGSTAGPLVGPLRRPGQQLLDLVNASCAAVSHDPVELARRFYAHLFTLAPQVRGLFPADLEPQSERLCRALLDAMAATADPQSFEQQLVRMGARHYQDYGVRATAYPLVGRALVAAVRDVAGSGWSSQTCAAWVAVYEWLAWHMVRGALWAGDTVQDLPGALAIAPGDLPPTLGVHQPARPRHGAGVAAVASRSLVRLRVGARR